MRGCYEVCGCWGRTFCMKQNEGVPLDIHFYPIGEIEANLDTRPKPSTDNQSSQYQYTLCLCKREHHRQELYDEGRLGATEGWKEQGCWGGASFSGKDDPLPSPCGRYAYASVASAEQLCSAARRATANLLFLRNVLLLLLPLLRKLLCSSFKVYDFLDPRSNVLVHQV